MKINLINEDIVTITSGIRNYIEEFGYEYSEYSKKHKLRYLFEPLRFLEKKDIVNRYILGENVFPESVEIDPANSCNHDCPFCIYSSLHKQGRREQLSKEVLFKLVSALFDLGCKSILFIGGGEPLTNKHTVEVMEFAASKSISVGLVTNGSLISEKNLERIANSATYVRISLDAATSETYELMHKSKDFDKIANNIRMLANEKKCTVGVSYFVNEYNYLEIPLASEFAFASNADYIQFKSYAGISHSMELHIEILEKLRLALKYSTGDFDVHIMDGLLQNSFLQVRGYSKCHWQNFKTIIGADGDVYVCTQKRGDKKAVIGNVNLQSIQEIWCGEQRKKVLESIVLKDCPFCVHHKQNSMLEYFQSFSELHKNFY